MVQNYYQFYLLLNMKYLAKFFAINFLTVLINLYNIMFDNSIKLVVNLFTIISFNCVYSAEKQFGAQFEKTIISMQVHI